MEEKKDDIQITSLAELNYGDVENNKENWIIPVLPWGAIEPHGTHLPYMTDSILATAVAERAILKTASFFPDSKNKFILMPAVSFGQQNLGQVNKKLCFNFKLNTQYCILRDIVDNLWKQNIYKLVIVNGHNGNDFKPIIRDLATEYGCVKIYLCNYLDLAKDVDGVDLPEVDDHAAFTETSLIMHLDKSLVNMNNMKQSVYEARLGHNSEDWIWPELEKNSVKGQTNSFWSPRNFDKASVKNRIGSVENANEKDGEKIFEYVTDILAVDLNRIISF